MPFRLTHLLGMVALDARADGKVRRTAEHEIEAIAGAEHVLVSKIPVADLVSVAKTVVEPLTDREGFEETPKIVDGYQVYAWSGEGAGPPGGS